MPRPYFSPNSACWFPLAIYQFLEYNPPGQSVVRGSGKWDVGGDAAGTTEGAGARVSLFDWLLVAHLVGDFLIQTDNMASHKLEDWPWMLRHVGCYMVIVSAVLLAYSVAYRLPLWQAVLGLLFIGATHVLLDRRFFTLRWMRLVGMSPDHPWLGIVVDQVFHILSLALVAQFLTLGTG